MAEETVSLVTGATIAEFAANAAKTFGDRFGKKGDIRFETRWSGNPQTGKTEYRLHICSYPLGGRIEHGTCDKVWEGQEAFITDWNAYADTIKEEATANG